MSHHVWQRAISRWCECMPIVIVCHGDSTLVRPLNLGIGAYIIKSEWERSGHGIWGLMCSWNIMGSQSLLQLCRTLRVGRCVVLLPTCYQCVHGHGLLACWQWRNEISRNMGFEVIEKGMSPMSWRMNPLLRCCMQNAQENGCRVGMLNFGHLTIKRRTRPE